MLEMAGYTVGEASLDIPPEETVVKMSRHRGARNEVFITSTG